MSSFETCGLPPFRYQSTPQVDAQGGVSGIEINNTQLENYLASFLAAVCVDFGSIVIPPPSGIDRFLELLDTPDTYVGQQGKTLVVNTLETALTYFPSTFTGQGQKMVVVKATEDGFELQTQPVLPTYFLTPRLTQGWSATIGTNGFGAVGTAVTGAQVVIPSSPANALAASYRFSFTAAAALNSNALVRGQAFQCIRGTAAPMGGFKLRWRFGLDQFAAGARCFIGLWNSIAAQPFTTANPSALTNVIFLGFDNTDTTWQIMHNDNAGTCTKVNTTETIAVGKLLELVITMQPSASSFDWELHNLEAGTSNSGSVNTNLPQGTVPLVPAMQIGSAASGVQQRLDHVVMFLETGPSP